MHIKDMMRPRRQRSTAEPPDSNYPRVPVVISIGLDSAVAKPAQLLQGIQRIKQTAWYRGLRKRNLQFVPLSYQYGLIIIAVGTPASLGLAYLAYKRLKRRQSEQNAASRDQGQ